MMNDDDDGRYHHDMVEEDAANISLFSQKVALRSIQQSEQKDDVFWRVLI